MDDRFEYRAYVIKAADQLTARRRIAEAQREIAREHGPGWEFEGSLPGAVTGAGVAQPEQGLVLVFRRRKQPLVTGVSVGPA